MLFNFPSLRNRSPDGAKRNPGNCFRWRDRPGFRFASSGLRYYAFFTIAFRASANPISTNADVTSGPPTRIRVGVFILFHS